MKDMRNNTINVNKLEEELKRFADASGLSYCNEVLYTAIFIDKANEERFSSTGEYWFIPRALVPYAYDCCDQLLHNVDSYGCDWDWAFGEDGMNFVLVEDNQCPPEDWFKDEHEFETRFEKVLPAQKDEEVPDTLTSDWGNATIINPDTFVPVKPGSAIAKKYSLRSISRDDLFFTGEIEDDRINVTATFADYDWMAYRYDARIPTKDLGTLAVRFDYFGAFVSNMYVKQFLPSYLTSKSQNHVITYEFSFPSEIFDEFMAKDLKARLKSIEETSVHYPGEIILEWFNTVLENGKLQGPIPDDQMPELEWEYVRAPRRNKSQH